MFLALLSDTLLGLTLVVEAKMLRVVSIDPGSPAEKAGMRIDDALLSCNEHPVGSMEADTLEQQLAVGHGEKDNLKTLVMKRHSDGKTVSFLWKTGQLFNSKP